MGLLHAAGRITSTRTVERVQLPLTDFVLMFPLFRKLWPGLVLVSLRSGRAGVACCAAAWRCRRFVRPLAFAVLVLLKVVVSLSPCFRVDFPESVTADRYVTSE